MLGYIKIGKLAKDLGVSKQTLWNWKYENKIEFTKIGNLNFVDLDTYHKLLGIQNKENEKVIIYCRVSSSVNKTNLQTQKNRLVDYCNAKGYKVSEIIEEYGSGLNDKRPKLEKLLKTGDYSKIVVEHKDRLCRHGFNYIETLLNKENKTIEVVNEPLDDKEDLMTDFISVITSYCARIYGNRRSKRKTEKIVEELSKND
jgi:putative resolvase